jgi:hypothetical protein
MTPRFWRLLLFGLATFLLAPGFAAADPLPSPRVLSWSPPDHDGLPFFKLGDMLEVKLVLQRPYLTTLSPRGRLQLMLGPLAIPLSQEGPTLFSGSIPLNRKGVYLDGEPAQILYLSGNSEISLGSMGAFHIDTLIPTARDLAITYTDAHRIQLDWNADGLKGGEHFTIQARLSTGRVEDVAVLQASETGRFATRATHGAYRIQAKDRAGNISFTDWVTPQAHVGCFPVWEGINPTKWTFCFPGKRSEAFIENYPGCKQLDQNSASCSPSQCTLFYECRGRYTDTIHRAEWKLRFQGPGNGWSGTLSIIPLDRPNTMSATETLHIRAWWGK